MVEILYHEELLYLSSQILIHGDVMLAWNQPQEYLYHRNWQMLQIRAWLSADAERVFSNEIICKRVRNCLRLYNISDLMTITWNRVSELKRNSNCQVIVELQQVIS